MFLNAMKKLSFTSWLHDSVTLAAPVHPSLPISPLMDSLT